MVTRPYQKSVDPQVPANVLTNP